MVRRDIAVMGVKFGAKKIYLSLITPCLSPCNGQLAKAGRRVYTNTRWLIFLYRYTAFFTDGASATVVTVILATGYQTRFPFIGEKLAISKKTSFYPEKIYKATVRMGVADHKLFFIGSQAGLYSFSLFDNIAAWIAQWA
ncbi:hypothetical protein MAR_000369 [Mya arenaria]|uniref:Uncharacterized protein n=1 Tax=Mya arenaria TaxID=6604 RepID=A0ABY7FCN6_MYAAR|nr:hypothetical protein MAR_000369 [Mya arenaria]